MCKSLKRLVIILTGFVVALAVAAPVTVQTYAVVVGTYNSADLAAVQVQRLKRFYEGNEEIAALQKSNGFDYEVAQSGDYFVARIAPIAGTEAMQKMLETSLEMFVGAYPLKLDRREVPAEQSEMLAEQPAPSVAAEEGAGAAAPVEEEPAAAPKKEAVTEISEPKEETPPAAAKAAVQEPEAAAVPEKQVETPQPATPPAAVVPPAAPADQPDLTALLGDERVLYGAAGVVVLLLLFLLLRPKKKPLEREEERPETTVTVEETPEAERFEAMPEPEPFREEAELPEAELPEAELPEEELFGEEGIVGAEEIAEAVPEVPTPPEPEAAIAEAEAGTRKRRSYKQTGTPIGKEDFKLFSGTRLLVAEDNLINQKVITSLLADTGIEITIANDGQEAMNILKKERGFDMVLMDAHMPVMDGFEATRAIRADSDYEAIPVIALSGDTGADDIRKMEEAGMEAHLEKPLRLDALYEVLYNYTGTLPGEEEAEALLPDTPELHAEEGLDRSMGDKSLYREILEEFSQMYGNSHETLQGCMVRGSLEEAEAMLLDVYGIAANIGADRLSESAEMLREALLEGREVQYNELLEAYRKHLEAVLSDIKKV